MNNNLSNFIKPIYSSFLIFSLIIIIISFFTKSDIQHKLNIAGYTGYGVTIFIILIVLINDYYQKLNQIIDIIPFSLILIYILLNLYLLITHNEKISVMNVSKDYYNFLFILICITIFQIFILLNIYKFEIIFENLSNIKKAILILTSIINIICLGFIYSILSLNITDG